MVREGFLYLSTSGSKMSALYCFLFNDIMVCSKEKSKKQTIQYDFRLTINLRDVSLEDFSPVGDRSDQFFKLVEKGNKGRTLLWKAPSKEEKQQWMLDIQTALRVLKENPSASGLIYKGVTM